MGKQAINLILASKSYSFTINSEAEEVYRLAEREVNSCVSEYQKHNVKDFSVVDYLALTALKLAIININAKREGSLQQEDVDALSAIKEQIDSYLNGLKEEK
ncbi:MAG: cell division protein ZapA [Rikenellaceae bacterium]